VTDKHQTIFLLSYMHEHGVDYTVCADEATAECGVLELAEEYFDEFDDEDNEHAVDVRAAIDESNAERVCNLWDKFTNDKESIEYEGPLAILDEEEYREMAAMRKFPWNLEPGDKVAWTDPDGGTQYVFPIKSIDYKGTKGQDDCPIHITHDNGELECLHHELKEVKAGDPSLN
jgi:hypothetical protein